jgi:hypothetical protein
MFTSTALTAELATEQHEIGILMAVNAQAVDAKLPDALFAETAARRRTR